MAAANCGIRGAPTALHLAAPGRPVDVQSRERSGAPGAEPGAAGPRRPAVVCSPVGEIVAADAEPGQISVTPRSRGKRADRGVTAQQASPAIGSSVAMLSESTMAQPWRGPVTVLVVAY